MPTYTFFKQPDKTNPYDNTEVIITCETEDLNNLLEAFREFIYACGFSTNIEDIEVVMKDEDD